MQRRNEVRAAVSANHRSAKRSATAYGAIVLAGLAMLCTDARAETGSEPNRDGGSEEGRAGEVNKGKATKRDPAVKTSELPVAPPSAAPAVPVPRDTRPPAGPALNPSASPPPSAQPLPPASSSAQPPASPAASPSIQPPAGPVTGNGESKKDNATSDAGQPKGVNPATGSATPPIVGQADRFMLLHRRLLPDEDLIIRVERGSEQQRIYVEKVELFYEQQDEGEDDNDNAKKLATSSPPDRVRKMDLTPYQSLDAASSQLHIALHRRYLAQATEPIKPAPSIWKQNYALWRSQPATLLISYVSVEEGQDPKLAERRTVTLHPAFTNRLRGIFWGVLGLLISLLCTCLIGLGQLRRRQRDNEQAPLSRGEKFWYVLLGASCTSADRFSLSGLQVVIWTHVAAFSLAYVWTMTGEVVELTPQLLMLLSIGGGTAVLARLTKASVPSGFEGLLSSGRLAGPWDLIASADAPSVFKFQMLIFTLVSAAIVAWEVASTYSFPKLPDALVTLMGISNSTYLLGGLAGNSGMNDLKKEIDESVRKLDKLITDWNAGNQPVAEKWKHWSRGLLVQRFIKPGPDDRPLSEEVQTLLQTIQNNLYRLSG